MQNLIRSAVMCGLLFSTAVSCSSGEKNSGDELLIIADVTVQSQYRDGVIVEFEKLVAETRKEAGNVSYKLWEDTADPNKFTLVEVWKSESSIDSHNNSAHFQAFVNAIANKADVAVRIYKQKL